MYYSNHDDSFIRPFFSLILLLLSIHSKQQTYNKHTYRTDPHLIAWFSAGAFVLLGFPISMYGIVMHLANYNQPNVQNYVVRILWMVPIYSIESWLCLRYKDYAIYIETLRDCYESYVLYSFLQFLIQVLGGEEALILMLKDKSPTRGVHMWGLQWCVKPWLMGQPLRKTFESAPIMKTTTTTNSTTMTMAMDGDQAAAATTAATTAAAAPRTLKRVHWTSPFFVQCKFGVLQYVLLKFILSVIVMLLEHFGMYKEGDFTPKGGYLYICILTNLSQCWALYCLIFFYYATKNELSNIRPVGKFLSVKALVFFTWWQSVMISIFYQMDLIPHYHGGNGMGFGGIIAYTNSNSEDNTDDGGAIMIDTSGGGGGNSMFMPLTAEEALRLDEFGGSVLSSDSSSFFSTPTTTAESAYHYVPNNAKQQEWSAEDVAKGLQDYLICIEMFVAAIVHIFVFSHTEYDPQAVEARTRALNQTPHKDWNKRLGRKWKEWDNKSGWSGTTNTSRDSQNFELASFSKQGARTTTAMTTMTMTMTMTNNNTMTATSATLLNCSFDDEDEDLRIHPLDRLVEKSRGLEDDEDDDEENRERKPLLASDNEELQSLESSFLHGSSSYFDDGDDDDDDEDEEEEEGDEENPPTSMTATASFPSVGSSSSTANNNNNAAAANRKPGFVRALLDSAIPQDLRDNTVGIIKGDYVVEKKTLLHHAATSDSYDLFSRVGLRRPKKPSSIYTKSSQSSVDY
jgi:hypothetical protein